jgi:hypothetical protein
MRGHPKRMLKTLRELTLADGREAASHSRLFSFVSQVAIIVAFLKAIWSGQDQWYIWMYPAALTGNYTLCKLVNRMGAKKCQCSAQPSQPAPTP